MFSPIILNYQSSSPVTNDTDKKVSLSEIETPIRKQTSTSAIPSPVMAAPVTLPPPPSSYFTTSQEASSAKLNDTPFLNKEDPNGMFLSLASTSPLHSFSTFDSGDVKQVNTSSSLISSTKRRKRPRRNSRSISSNGNEDKENEICLNSELPSTPIRIEDDDGDEVSTNPVETTVSAITELGLPNANNLPPSRLPDQEYEFEAPKFYDFAQEMQQEEHKKHNEVEPSTPVKASASSTLTTSTCPSQLFAEEEDWFFKTAAERYGIQSPKIVDVEDEPSDLNTMKWFIPVKATKIEEDSVLSRSPFGKYCLSMAKKDELEQENREGSEELTTQSPYSNQIFEHEDPLIKEIERDARRLSFGSEKNAGKGGLQMLDQSYPSPVRQKSPKSLAQTSSLTTPSINSPTSTITLTHSSTPVHQISKSSSLKASSPSSTTCTPSKSESSSKRVSFLLPDEEKTIEESKEQQEKATPATEQRHVTPVKELTPSLPSTNVASALAQANMIYVKSPLTRVSPITMDNLPTANSKSPSVKPSPSISNSSPPPFSISEGSQHSPTQNKTKFLSKTGQQQFKTHNLDQHLYHNQIIKPEHKIASSSKVVAKRVPTRPLTVPQSPALSTKRPRLTMSRPAYSNPPSLIYSKQVSGQMVRSTSPFKVKTLQKTDPVKLNLGRGGISQFRPLTVPKTPQFTKRATVTKASTVENFATQTIQPKPIIDEINKRAAMTRARVLSTRPLTKPITPPLSKPRTRNTVTTESKNGKALSTESLVKAALAKRAAVANRTIAKRSVPSTKPYSPQLTTSRRPIQRAQAKIEQSKVKNQPKVIRTKATRPLTIPQSPKFTTRKPRVKALSDKNPLT